MKGKKVKEDEKKEWERRVKTQFQLTWGATLRAVAEHDRELAQRLARAIVSCMSDLLPTEKKEEAKAPKTWGDLADKSTVVLAREQKVLGMLLQSDKPIGFARLFAVVQSDESSLSGPTLVTTLSRLKQLGAIERPGRGRYRASTQSSNYLELVNRQLEKRSS